MTSPINGNVEIHEIDVEETFKKVLNTDGMMPSQILSIKEENRCSRLVAIDFSCMKRIQQYGLLIEEAQRLDREYIVEMKEAAVIVGGTTGIVCGASIGMVAGNVLNSVTSSLVPGISSIASIAKLACYAIPIILGAKKGYELGKQSAIEFLESQHPNFSKLTAKMWENEVLIMGNIIVEISYEIGTKKEKLLHVQAGQISLLQKEIQQLEALLNHFSKILKNANSLNSAMMNKCIN
ncbi:MAG: hypothetical protein ACRCU0_03545 [Candidatus Rhabdochlamydia sp.]